MLNQLLSGGLVSLVNFGLHALMTGIIVVATHHIAAATDELHVFARVTSLMTITLVVLMFTHVIEIAVWASYYAWAGIETEKFCAFAFAFEIYTHTPNAAVPLFSLLTRSQFSPPSLLR